MCKLNYLLLVVVGAVALANYNMSQRQELLGFSDLVLDKIEALAAINSECSNCNTAGGKGSTSCSCTGSTVSGPGLGGGGAACEVSVSDGYYACCLKDSNGICRCPSCPKSGR